MAAHLENRIWLLLDHYFGHMWTLHIVNGPGGPREYPLLERETVIGRNAPNAERKPDIALEDMQVSRTHVRLILVENDLRIECPGANGVEMDGQTVRETRLLSSGSRFTICSTVFEVRSDSAAESQAIAPQGTIIHEREEPSRVNLETAARSPKQRKHVAAVGGIILLALVVIAGLGTMLSSSSSPGATAQKAPGRKGENKEVLSSAQRKERIQIALDQAKQAKKLFDERRILPGNRYRALVLYSEAIVSGESANSSNLPMGNWMADSAKLSMELDSIYQVLSKKAIAAFKQNRDNLSRTHLRAIMEMFPDASESRYQWAKKNMISLDRK